MQTVTQATDYPKNHKYQLINQLTSVIIVYPTKTFGNLQQTLEKIVFL